MKYIALPLAQSLGPPSTSVREEQYIVQSAVTIGSIIAGYFLGKELSRENRITYLIAQNPEKAKKVRERDIISYELRTKASNTKWNKVDRAMTNGFAYFLRAAAYTSGTLETIAGGLLITAAILNIVNPPQSTINYLKWNTMNAVAILFGSLTLIDGIYTLRKKERPHHLFITGIEKIIGRGKEIMPKYSTLIKEAKNHN